MSVSQCAVVNACGFTLFDLSEIAKTAVVVFAVWIRSEFYRSFAISNQNRKINFNFIHNVEAGRTRMLILISENGLGWFASEIH